MRWWAFRQIRAIEARDVRVVLEVAKGRNGGSIEVFTNGRGVIVIEVPLQSVQPCDLRMFAHKPQGLHFAFTIEVLFCVVDGWRVIAETVIGIFVP